MEILRFLLGVGVVIVLTIVGVAAWHRNLEILWFLIGVGTGIVLTVIVAAWHSMENDKAGRDREAAESARAEVEARAKGEAAPAGTPGGPPPEAAAGGGALAAPDTPIPPPAVGESDA